MQEKSADNVDAAHHVVQTKEPQPDSSVGIPLLRRGTTVFPTPTSDPLDPLNWTSVRKHTILAIVCLKYFLFTYITTTTVPSFPDLQERYAISYFQVNWTVAIPALGLAVGPLLWSSFADIYGRRVVFMVGTLMAFGATIGAARASKYDSYMAARFFQGLGVSPGATVGLAVLNDMFFEHERGQKVGLWVLAIDSGLFVGPIFGGFLNVVSAAWIQWFTAILFGVLFILELLFMPETLYPRSRMLTLVPLADDGGQGTVDLERIGTKQNNAPTLDIRRTKQLTVLDAIKPVPGMKHPKPWDSILRFALTFRLFVVPVAVLTYCFCWYWFILSVVTMLPAAYPDYSPLIQGLLFVGLLLGTLFAEILCGGRLSDIIVARAAKMKGGVRMPEQRLWLVYPAGVSTAVGLILWGVSVDQAYPWIVGQVAFFLFAAGIQVGNTVVVSYIVDAYPLQSMSTITFYSVFLNLSGFLDPFFVGPWQASSGWTWCFAAQGIIVVFGALPVMGALHKFGPTLRAKSATPSWVNPEHDTAT